MSFYLLEIGCEELPAGFVTMASEYIYSESEARLRELHLPYSKMISNATPRRIYLYIEGLPEKQADREDSIQGPPAKIAFNPDGTVSEAGLKFARSKGLDPATLSKITTDKGGYLTGIKKMKGEDTKVLLSQLMAKTVLSIPFSKSMRWGDRDIRFGRPLKYILSLFDGNILPIDISGIPTVDTTVGHRFLAPQPVKVKDFDSYKNALKKGRVIADIQDRRDSILVQMATLSQKGAYVADTDAALLDTVANLVEEPYAIEGSFSNAFLELPAPVLTTSMKHHQKFFPVHDKNLKLLPKFIGISNMRPANDSLIRGGYERVLSARLNDAIFFYNNDKKTPLEERVEMLKKVVYQEKLGTSYEKMERFRTIAVALAYKLAPDKTELVQEAATLCKADLMCEMVYEFPELQGFMGKVYAEIQGKPAEVCTAIEEHYLPRFAGDKLPATDTGRMVAIADKLDTITSAFAVGMIPSGNVDPYGLRRNTIGIINIIEDAGWQIPLPKLIAKSLENVKTKATKDLAELTDMVTGYFLQRQRQLLITREAADADAYDAAASMPDNLINIRDRAVALTGAKKSESFYSIAQSYKRINNILKKAEFTPADVNDALFEHDEEAALYKLYIEKCKTIKQDANEKNWPKAAEELITLANPLNAYFEKVMVMTPQANVKTNRLSMLQLLKNLFNTLGDLSKIG